MPRYLTRCTVVCLASLQAFLLLSAPVGAEVLKGNVSETGERRKDGLSRSDINSNPNADPFSDDKPDQEIMAPDNMFKMDQPDRPPPPPPPLAGRVDDRGHRPMQQMMPKGNPFEGEEEPMPMQQPPPPPMQPRAQQQDPEMANPEMALAWDQWHRRVAEAIYTRFNFLAKLAFRRSPPLLCQVGYNVTRDGHIQNVQVQQKSPNVLFNVVVFQTVKSLDGDYNLLQFPPGSRRQFVPKVGTFTQNYGGDGFKYTVGDTERLQQQRR